jgi:hypothetical protein
VQTVTRAPADASPSHAAAQTVPPATQREAAPQASPPQSAKGPAAPVSGLGELAVSVPLSSPESAAAEAASADLKTLEEQIAANPPSGPASPPNAANRGSATSADLMAPSQYLGQTFDLEGDSATSNPRPRSPDSIRRRAHSRWRRHAGQQ